MSSNKQTELVSLTPVVRDACLKAMQLSTSPEDKQSFDRFYLFCQEQQTQQQTQGSTLAMALLYTRLYSAFGKRHLVQINNTSTAGQAALDETYRHDVDFAQVDSGTRTKAGATNDEEKSEDEDQQDDTTDIGKVFVQNKFEANPTNVELSPRVSGCIYRMVNDLLAVHALLPKTSNSNNTNQNDNDTTKNQHQQSSSTRSSSLSSSWTGWSVVQVCVLAHDFVVESVSSPKLRKAWKIALHGTAVTSANASSERDMFFIFCEKTTEWMAGRVIRAVEAYQDYVFVWSLTTTVDEDTRRTKDQETLITAAQIQKKSEQRLNLLQLKWEPQVPEFSAISETEDDLSEDNNMKEPESSIDRETRARIVVWNLSVFYALFQQQQQEQCTPSRRQRLLASVAALGLVMGLHRLTHTDDDTNKNKSNVKILDTLLTAANQECAFTRWACLDHLKMEGNLMRQEVVRATLRLAKAVYTFAQSRGSERMIPRGGGKLADVSSQPDDWLQELDRRVGHDPVTLLWNLPSLATDLVDSFSRQLRQEKIKVEASFYYDETSIVHSERHIELLCNFLDRPMEIGHDSRLTVVAPKLDSLRKDNDKLGGARKVPTGMAAQPYKVEKLLADSRKRLKFSNGNYDFLKAATPAVISESMELTEWTVALLHLEQVRPTARLREFLGDAGSLKDNPKQHWTKIIIPIINATLLKLSQEGLMGKTTRKSAVYVQNLKQAGELDAVGTVVMTAVGDLTHDKALCRALVAFYYHALECMLVYESKRLSGKKAFPNLILNKEFHQALLSCCTKCVVKAVGYTQKLCPSPDIQSIQIYQALLVCDCNPYEFLKVSEFFVKSLSVPTGSSSDNKGSTPFLIVLPRILKRDMQRSETNLLESLLWARDPKFVNTFPDRLEEFDERTAYTGIGWWPVQSLYPSLPEELLDQPDGPADIPKFPTPDMAGYTEYKHICRIIEKLLGRFYQRMAALCQALDIPSSSPLVKHAWIALRYLMRWRIDVFYDRHVDHWILCCLYGVAKQFKMEPEVKFAAIVDAYVAVRGPEMGDITCQRIVRNIKIVTAANSGTNTTQWGNVIMLYNKEFVPIMKDYLFHSKSLEKAADQVRQTVRFSVASTTHCQ